MLIGVALLSGRASLTTFRPPFMSNLNVIHPAERRSDLAIPRTLLSATSGQVKTVLPLIRTSTIQ
jgi:hypothetical protein